jgi:2-polyprenyl-3-methyl-5-hydroxy-6-metoxy-1,4-benzoquinol methylase
MKILVWSPIKADATSYYRAWGPLQHLARHYEGVQLIDISIPEMEISWAILMQGDVLFMQRPSTDTEVRVMEIAKNANIPIWIDYDDDYFKIPETNPRHELYAHPHRVEQIRRAIEYADVITVSTIPLKNSIVSITGKSKNAIQVIPNGVDETIFNTKMPGMSEIGVSRDVVLWRGGDTHAADLDPYIEKMVQLYNEFPKYKWAFVGAAPEKFLKLIDTNRVMLYAWEDLFVYFDRLFELNPKITIVPWASTEFNESKSNCSWIESTLAGAATIFPRWSSEFVEGMEGYNNPEDFYTITRDHLKREFSGSFVQESFSTLKRFTLYSLNSTRYSIARELIEKKAPIFGFRNPKYNVLMEPVSDEGFFRYTHEKGFIQDNEAYKQAHYKVAQGLLERYKPNSIIEIGCGPGPMLEYFLDKKVPQVVGFEFNKHFRDYFIKRNPHYTANFICEDINDGDLDGVFDLCVSIEVFEHIHADKCDALIERLSHHFKFLYFSSTPYHTSKTFDRFWGHQNLRTHEGWIKSFEERGWLYEGNPQMVTQWDHCFKSVRHGDVPVIEIR